MPTANSHNGTAPTASHPRSKPDAAAAVQKGGPFELAEIERLANEMFRALPGAFLPGLAPEELDAVGLDAETAALRPAAVTPPAVNGQVSEAETALRVVADELDAVTGRFQQAARVESPTQWSYVLDGARSRGGPACTAPAIRGRR